MTPTSIQYMHDWFLNSICVRTKRAKFRIRKLAKSQQCCQLKQMTGSDEKERNKNVNECNSSAVMIACKTLKYNFFLLALSLLLSLSICSITLCAHLLHSIELQHFIIISCFFSTLFLCARSVYAHVNFYLFALRIRAVIGYFICYSTDDDILLSPVLLAACSCCRFVLRFVFFLVCDKSCNLSCRLSCTSRSRV